MKRYILYLILLLIGFSFNSICYSYPAFAMPYHQQDLLGWALGDINAENKLTKSCQLVGDDKLDQAMTGLQKIRWWKTSINAKMKKIDDKSNKLIIVFFQNYRNNGPVLNEGTCRMLSRAFILDPDEFLVQ